MQKAVNDGYYTTAEPKTYNIGMPAGLIGPVPTEIFPEPVMLGITVY
jgi:hypothetical protein